MPGLLPYLFLVLNIGDRPEISFGLNFPRAQTSISKSLDPGFGFVLLCLEVFQPATPSNFHILN